jgi:hypothetical protein
LPETRLGTLTNLAFQYLLARPSVTLTREANVLSDRMLDAQGRPVAAANLTVDALDVAGSLPLDDFRCRWDASYGRSGP